MNSHSFHLLHCDARTVRIVHVCFWSVRRKPKLACLLLMRASRRTTLHSSGTKECNEICRYLRRRSGFRPGGDAVIGIQPFVSPAHTSRGADRIVLRTHPKCLNAQEKTCRQKEQQHHQASDGRCGRRRGARGIRWRRNGHCFAGDFQPYQGQ